MSQCEFLTVVTQFKDDFDVGAVGLAIFLRDVLVVLVGLALNTRLLLFTLSRARLRQKKIFTTPSSSCVAIV